jgi:hypothetical protein
MNREKYNEYKCKECLHYSSGICFLKILENNDNIYVDKNDSCEKAHPTTKAFLKHQGHF